MRGSEQKSAYGISPLQFWSLNSRPVAGMERQFRRSRTRNKTLCEDAAMNILVCSFFFASILLGQETRREITNAAANPADDQKQNGATVPDVYAIHGQFERIVILRFK